MAETIVPAGATRMLPAASRQTTTRTACDVTMFGSCWGDSEFRVAGTADEGTGLSAPAAAARPGGTFAAWVVASEPFVAAVRTCAARIDADVLSFLSRSLMLPTIVASLFAR